MMTCRRRPPRMPAAGEDMHPAARRVEPASACELARHARLSELFAAARRLEAGARAEYLDRHREDAGVSGGASEHPRVRGRCGEADRGLPDRVLRDGRQRMRRVDTYMDTTGNSAEPWIHATHRFHWLGREESNLRSPD